MIISGWVIYSPIRDIKDNNPVLQDIRNHLPSTHQFASHDKVNYVHEGTHGINAQLRRKYHKPGFYCLNNKAYIFNRESPGTLNDVAVMIPQSLRGNAYHLYLISQQKDWNNQPSYLFDEFSAYINGSKSREKTDRTDTIENMLQFIVYCYYVPDSKIFWKDRTKEALRIYKQSGHHSDYYDKPGFQRIIKELDKDYNLW